MQVGGRAMLISGWSTVGMGMMSIGGAGIQLLLPRNAQQRNFPYTCLSNASNSPGLCFLWQLVVNYCNRIHDTESFAHHICKVNRLLLRCNNCTPNPPPCVYCTGKARAWFLRGTATKQYEIRHKHFTECYPKTWQECNRAFHPSYDRRTCKISGVRIVTTLHSVLFSLVESDDAEPQPE